MTLLSAANLSKKFNKQTLLENVSFSITSHDRIGLVGRNGSGKTTLFEILVGLAEADNGAINKSKNCRIDYVEQEKTDHLDTQLFEFVSLARQDLHDLRAEISEMERALTSRPDDSAALNRLGQLQQEFEAAGGFTFESEIKLILIGLGFEASRHSERIQNFSGGEKNRAGLARALAGNGNLLLLDEPTNHLDIESTKWLEEYLVSIDKAFLVVSHDRAFLSATVSKVWEIHFARIDFYSCKFEQFIEERKQRNDQHDHRYQLQQAEIKRIEDFVRRNMAGQKTKQAQSKLKYLSRMKRLEPPKSDGRSDIIRMTSSGRSYAHVLSAREVALGYSDREVVRDVDFDIYRGDKIGLVGKNGSGKTTILKSLIGALAPIRGEIKLGSNTDVAYFDQELSDLNPDATALDTIWELDPMVEIGQIRSYLARYGFSGEESLKKVVTLSGGEKTKLSLARILYHPANFIIFDEPTNHLDLDSRETLEQALIDYDGSCLIVSHDRFLLDQVATQIMHINNGFLKSYPGNYSYFAEKIAEATAAMPTVEKSSSSKESYLAFKDKSRQKTRLKKQIQSTESKIADTEKEIEKLSRRIDSEIPRSDWEALGKAASSKSELEELLLQLYDRLEELKGIQLD
ncbi:MAG: ABC-F family ATP-binding cassette domain-containing protein [bacterium]|nr:ABC-F family ATP-binding cassette domain-containing protein [bacterium]